MFMIQQFLKNMNKNEKIIKPNIFQINHFQN